MGVRPPQGDSSDPDHIEFGIAALDARLDDAEIEYPVAKRELVEGLGDVTVPYDASGSTVTLGEALEKVPREQFESESELLELLHPVFEEYRLSASNSIVGRLRSLLPF